LSILFLSHRIPYPPDKGDKIRSYHLLRGLAEAGHAVHLGCLMDDPGDRAGVGALSALCASVCAVPIHPKAARLRSLPHLAGRQPLSLPYFRSRRLRAWVEGTLAAGGVDVALAFSSPVVDYLLPFRSLAAGGPAGRSPVPLVVDFVDVDSEKWRQYAARTGGLTGWVYRREAHTLAAYEAAVARAAEASVLTSEVEADLLRAMAPEARVEVVPNGVDTAYFDPDAVASDPGAGSPELGDRLIVFTGAMDYAPNVDAVRWFAAEVLPTVRRAHPGARFRVVGSRPAGVLRDLAARDPAVEVTGRVPDVRPHLRAADVVVAPMRMGRGVQNKVLEAMAMGCAVVASPLALQGLGAATEAEVAAADGPEAFAGAVLSLLQGREGAARRAAMGAAARAWVRTHCTWEASLSRLETILETARRGTPAGARLRDAARATRGSG